MRTYVSRFRPFAVSSRLTEAVNSAAITFPHARGYRLSRTKVYCSVIEARGCARLAHSCYAAPPRSAPPRPGVKPETSGLQARRRTRHQSQKQALVTARLEKPSLHPDDLNSCRPISYLSFLSVLIYKVEYLYVFVSERMCEFVCLFITDKLGSLTIYPTHDTLFWIGMILGRA